MTESVVFTLEDRDRKILDLAGQYYTNQGLQYGWKSSNSKGYDQGHWNRSILSGSKTLPFDQSRMPLMRDEHPELMHLWKIIQAVIGERALVRVYINGYTYGTDGYSHVDDPWIKKRFGDDANSETCIMYLNNEWHPDWAGETVVFDENGDIESAVIPKPGRVFIFDSMKHHAARSVSRVCPELRKVIVFKTMDPAHTSKEVEFVLNQVEGIKHSGRTFFEHLYGTAMFMEKFGGSDDMVKAALFHSIYGTSYFKHDNPPTREEVRGLIGERAEDLAYKFCALEDRTNTLLDGDLPDDYTEEDRLDLLRIEMANLVEQNRDGRYDETLKRIQEKAFR